MSASEPISNELAYPGFDCDVDTINSYYVGVHAITAHQYDEMRKKFFQKIPLPDPRVFHGDYFIQWLNLDCGHNYIKFDFSETLRDYNDEITIDIFSSIEILSGRYSIHFFRGLFLLFQVQNDDKFEFSKAINSTGSFTLALRLLKADGTVLYHGDLTNMYP